MKLKTLYHQIKKQAGLLDELDTFFVHVPPAAWSSKQTLIDWVSSPKGQLMVSKHLGWPRTALVSYIDKLQGMAWSSLVRTYK